MPVPAQLYKSDNQLLSLAREIAIDLNDIETILKNHQIEPKQWDLIQKQPRFLKLLETEVLAWQSATNTHERTKLKAAAVIELWLEKANMIIHSDSEPLSGRAEVVKFLGRVAGLGLDKVTGEGGGERFSVTINLGGDQKLTFQKEVTPKVIEGTVLATPES